MLSRAANFFFISGLSVCLTFSACTDPGKKSDRSAADFNPREKAFYSFGAKYAEDIKRVAPDPEELAALVAGIADKVQNKLILSAAEIDEEAQVIEDEISKKLEIQSEENFRKGQEFLLQKKNDPAYLTTTSGISYRVLKEGRGAKKIDVTMDTIAHLKYIGKKIDGTIFDKSQGDKPTEFPLQTLIPCWQLMLALMPEGARFEFVCPPHLAFGEEGVPPLIQGGEVVAFELELTGFSEK